jgi:FkbM family methyltransferase
MVLHGAGRLGRRTLAGLRAVGREVLAFTDNDPGRWGGGVDGVEVLSTAEAARRYGESALFVVTVWRSEGGFVTAALCDDLRALGCRYVARLGELYWAYPERFLPYYGIDLPSRALAEPGAVRAAFAMFDDERSRAEFVAQLRWRLTLDASGLARGTAHPIYFAPDVVRLHDHETLVDAGAYDGDTLRAFIGATGGRFRAAVALEPDPYNRARLTDYAASLGALGQRVAVLPFALGASDGEVRFTADGTAGARLAGDEGLTVALRRLSSVEGARAMTFFKLDIEGAEPDALAGAAEIIQRNRPLLAVCAYHLQAHLWQLPLQLLAMLPTGYRWRLRAYSAEGFDLVLYAVPDERLADPA